jgi:hypothetical protein
MRGIRWMYMYVIHTNHSHATVDSALIVSLVRTIQRFDNGADISQEKSYLTVGGVDGRMCTDGYTTAAWFIHVDISLWMASAVGARIAGPKTIRTGLPRSTPNGGIGMPTRHSLFNHRNASCTTRGCQ